MGEANYADPKRITSEGLEMDAEQYEHLSGLLQAHRQRLHVVERQAAQFGLHAPAHMLVDIKETRKELANISAQLGMARVGLPDPVADFMGRDDEAERIMQMFITAVNDGSTAMICSIRGMGGLGKTQLARAVAQRLKPNFPDAQVLIQLRGMSKNPVTPVQALEQIIRVFKPMAELPKNLELEQLEGIYRTVLKDKRVLILADDAKNAVQVQSLVPPSGCALLITSRNHFALPGVSAINLGTMPPKHAEALLLNICPRIGDASLRMAELCGYLPLALRVSAGLLASDETRNVQRYLDLLVDERTKLAHLRDPDDPTLDVELSLQLSYNALERVAQDALCQVSVFPASFDLAAAQAVVDMKDKMEIEKILGLLYRRSLVEWDAITELYSLHDLIRAYAVVRLNDNGAARRRLNQYYVYLMEIDYLQEKLSVCRRKLAHQLEQQRQQTRSDARTLTQLSDDIRKTRKEIPDTKRLLRKRGVEIIDDPNEKMAQTPNWLISIGLLLVVIMFIGITLAL